MGVSPSLLWRQKVSECVSGCANQLLVDVWEAMVLFFLCDYVFDEISLISHSQRKIMLILNTYDYRT